MDLSRCLTLIFEAFVDGVNRVIQVRYGVITRFCLHLIILDLLSEDVDLSFGEMVLNGELGVVAACGGGLLLGRHFELFSAFCF